MENSRRTTARLAKRALWSTSVLALFALAPAAMAQQQSADNGPIEQVVVSGSRLVTNGAQAPTPVTVVSMEQLQLAAPTNVVDGLLQLPVFLGSQSVLNQSTGTTGSNGADNLNLRGLGVQRTLVLVDGRRMVPDASLGAVDAAQIPEALIKRVDVVTGGASAAYGSDAVAGVVNFVLDTNFVGLKADLQGGISTYGDDANYKFDVTGGESFMDDHLHVVGSFLDQKTDGVPNGEDRPWTATQAESAITNPNFNKNFPVSPTNTAQIVVHNGYSSVAALGGLITSGPLKGTTFDNQGQAVPFQYGTNLSAAYMEGGGGYDESLLLTLQPSQRRDQFFAHATYDVNDNLSVFLQVMASQNHIRYRSLPTFELSSTAFTIFSDNAYLPQSIKNYLALNPSVTSFTVGRESPDIAIPYMDAITNSGTVTAGFDGKFWSTWQYHAYGQVGKDYDSYKTLDDPISDNLYRAADAVVNPANGQIVCRSTLTNPTNGCVPLDIFGFGAPSKAALNYVNGTAIENVNLEEDIADFNVTGDLFDLQGGAASIAFGGTYRKESFTQTSNPQSQEIRTGAGINGFPAGLVNSLGGYERTNPQPAGGSYSVYEGFVETELPVFKDLPYAHALSFNAAGRYVDYSLSGSVEPWKIGAVYEPMEGIRFRISRSTDIRAPNLGELFQGSSQGTSIVQDPKNGNQTFSVLTGAVGNTALKPEIANTFTYGAVLTPDLVPGLTASIDYYSINIHDAISTLNAQQELNFCQNGSAQQCAFIIRNPMTGNLSRILLPYFNAADRLVKGVDFETSYNKDLSELHWGVNGDVSFRLLVSYLGQFTTQIEGAPPVQYAGDIDSNSTPKWNGLASMTYNNGPYTFFLQERMVGGGHFDNTNDNGLGITPNTVHDVWYTDTTFSYDINDNLTGFLTINNLFDRDPPPNPSYLIDSSSYGNRTLYDLVGRMYTIGLHYRM
ncbi:MAG TPA: TonB-dependent receptor [Rhizomicrobium sp.]|nr:TonB-dependent receptor [Rhizomicrobium sp.]